MVLVALTVLPAMACQRFWSKATAAPAMLVLLSGGVQWCSWHCPCCSRWLVSASGRRLLLSQRCSCSCLEACNGARSTDRAAREGLPALLVEDYVLLFGDVLWCS